MADAEKTLLDLKEKLDEVGLPFFLIASTLLGIYRDGEPLGLLEVGFLDKDYTEEVEEKLKKRIKISDPGGDRKDRAEKHCQLYLDGLGDRIEGHPVYFLGKYGYFNITEFQVLVWPRYMYEKLKKIKYAGEWWKMPSDTGKYLELFYGEDWRTPRGWAWGEAPNLGKIEASGGKKKIIISDDYKRIIRIPKKRR